MLDPTSPLPLYQQLADDLSARIDVGEYAPGARIPSEHELAARYLLGRPTVRQATEVLVRRRVLERRRGAGTFVREAPPQVDLFSLGGTLASFEQIGVKLRTRVTKKLRLRRVSENQDNPFGGQSAFSVTRLGSVNRRAVLLESMYFSPEAFPALDQRAAGAASLSRAITEHYAMRPIGGRQTFAVRRAGDLASLLCVSDDVPLLLVRRTLDFPGAHGALFAKIHCLTGEFVFAQNLLNPEGDFPNA
jgi:GntR family transcriptional regulator